MIKKHGKIIEATEEELFGVFLKTETYEIMTFDDYVNRMKEAGTKVIEDERED